MSEPADTNEEVERLDAPNQQVVRPDGSAPWDEGTGGGGDDAPPVAPEPLPTERQPEPEPEPEPER